MSLVLLPDDIKYLIFEYISPIELIRVIALVCKKLKTSLSEMYWRKRALNGRSLNKETQKIWEKFSTEPHNSFSFGKFPESFVLLKFLFYEIEDISISVLNINTCIALAIYNNMPALLGRILPESSTLKYRKLYTEDVLSKISDILFLCHLYKRVECLLIFLAHIKYIPSAILSNEFIFSVDFLVLFNKKQRKELDKYMLIAGLPIKWNVVDKFGKKEKSLQEISTSNQNKNLKQLSIARFLMVENPRINICKQCCMLSPLYRSFLLLKQANIFNIWCKELGECFEIAGKEPLIPGYTETHCFTGKCTYSK